MSRIYNFVCLGCGGLQRRICAVLRPSLTSAAENTQKGVHLVNVSDCLLHVLTQKVDYFLHNLSTCSSAGEDREIILTFEACFLQGIKVSRPGEFEMHLEDLLRH